MNSQSLDTKAPQTVIPVSNSPTDFSASEAIQVLDSQLVQRLQERQKLLGAVTWLMMNSPLHRQYTVQELSERVLPSILHNQFRIYEQDNRPIGFVNWAWLTDEVEEKYQTAEYELGFMEWTGGQNLWFPEFIAPFGHTKYIFRDLRKNFFPTQIVKGFKVNADGQLRGIVHYKSGRKLTETEAA